MPEKLKDDGSIPEIGVFDEPQVEVLEPQACFAAQKMVTEKNPPGGPSYISAAKHNPGRK
jgi:hypothetical protein